MRDASSHLRDAHCLSPRGAMTGRRCFQAIVSYPFVLRLRWVHPLRSYFLPIYFRIDLLTRRVPGGIHHPDEHDCWEVLKGCDLYVLGSLMTPCKFIIC